MWWKSCAAASRIVDAVQYLYLMVAHLRVHVVDFSLDIADLVHDRRHFRSQLHVHRRDFRSQFVGLVVHISGELAINFRWVESHMTESRGSQFAHLMIGRKFQDASLHLSAAQSCALEEGSNSFEPWASKSFCCSALPLRYASSCSRLSLPFPPS